MKAYENKFDQIVLLDEKEIITKNLCECHGEHGQVIGCYDAGCYSEDNSCSGWEKGEEETHIEVKVFEYHDGHNWRSLIVESDLQTDLEEVDEKLNESIVNDYKNAEWGDWYNGVCNGKTDRFTFKKSQFSNSYGIDVEFNHV